MPTARRPAWWPPAATSPKQARPSGCARTGRRRARQPGQSSFLAHEPRCAYAEQHSRLRAADGAGPPAPRRRPAAPAGQSRAGGSPCSVISERARSRAHQAPADAFALRTGGRRRRAVHCLALITPLAEDFQAGVRHATPCARALGARRPRCPRADADEPAVQRDQVQPPRRQLVPSRSGRSTATCASRCATKAPA